PLFTTGELHAAGVSIALYPLSAFRAANKAAENVYRHIRSDGSQSAVVDSMQTRAELYKSIDYYAYENSLDQLFNTKTNQRNKCHRGQTETERSPFARPRGEYGAQHRWQEW